MLGGEHGLDWAGGDDAAVDKHGDAVAHRVQAVEIVGDHEHGESKVRCRVRISSSKAAAPIGSRPEVGSSRKTISGSSASARASATRLIMPPDSSAGNFSATAGVEADHFELGERDLVDAAAATGRDTRASETERSGARSARRTARPAGTARPSAARRRAVRGRRGWRDRSRTPRWCLRASGSRPMIVRISTDLPAPEPPTKPRISPRKTSSVTRSSTVARAEADDEVAHADHRLVAAFRHPHIPIARKEHGEEAVEHDDEEDRFDHRAVVLQAERLGAALRP